MIIAGYAASLRDRCASTSRAPPLWDDAEQEALGVKKRDKLAIVRRYYPGAVTTAQSVDALFDMLEDRYDLEPTQIMLADSICSDDVNTIECPARAYEMLGPFKMGGSRRLSLHRADGHGGLCRPRTR